MTDSHFGSEFTLTGDHCPFPGLQGYWVGCRTGIRSWMESLELSYPAASEGEIQPG